jgi:hypothetical protein
MHATSPRALCLVGTLLAACSPRVPSPVDDGGALMEGCELPARIALEQVVPRDCDFEVSEDVVIPGGATLVLEPGATLRFHDGVGLDVAGGALEAVGEEGAEVRLLGLRGGPGAWRGIIVRSDEPRNRLHHVVLRGAGGGLHGGAEDNAGVYVDAGGRLSLAHSDVSDSGGFGLFAEANARLPNFSNNRFGPSDGGSVRVPASLLGSLDEASDYGGPLTASAAPVSVAQTWPATNSPIRLLGITVVTAALTIAPGASFLAEPGAGLDVSAGSLHAAGTAASQVLFEGGEAERGTWRGLIFRSGDEANRLVHTVVRHGGGERFTGTDEEANVYVAAGGRLDLLAVTVQDSASWGLYVEEGGALAEGAAAELLFARNEGGDLRLPAE